MIIPINGIEGNGNDIQVSSLLWYGYINICIAIRE
jgi:hypothetical protein